MKSILSLAQGHRHFLLLDYYSTIHIFVTHCLKLEGSLLSCFFPLLEWYLHVWNYIIYPTNTSLYSYDRFILKYSSVTAKFRKGSNLNAKFIILGLSVIKHFWSLYTAKHNRLYYLKSHQKVLQVVHSKIVFAHKLRHGLLLYKLNSRETVWYIISLFSWFSSPLNL